MKRKTKAAIRWYVDALRFVGETLCLPLVWLWAIVKVAAFGVALVGICLAGLIIYGFDVLTAGIKDLAEGEE